MSVSDAVDVPTLYPSFFTASVADVDPEIAQTIGRELGRQRNEIELIASENIVSRAVLEAMGSVLTNKYAEGYPGRRYYGGCEHVDVVEQLAIDRAKQLFNCAFANVQPNSGSQANQGAFMALIKPGDTILGLSLAAGGHLTHGAPPTSPASGSMRCSMASARKTPRSISTRLSGLPRNIAQTDYRRWFGLSADHRFCQLPRHRRRRSGHISWSTWRILPASWPPGVHPSPFPHAHVATTTTHKTLRGPRGGMIVTNDEASPRR